MKNPVRLLLFVSLLGTPSANAEVADSPWRSFVGMEGGFYDTGDAYIGMIEGGVGYESGPLIHYLFLGAGRVHRGHEDSGKGGLGGSSGGLNEDSLDEFELGYRLVYPLNDKLSVFAELGAESFSGNEHTTDALGNPVNFSLDSDHYFLGTGFQMYVWKGLNVDFSCRYLFGVDDAAFSRSGSDFLGNPLLIKGDTPNILVKIGIGYSF